MPLYEWRGKSATGEIRKGVLEAPNPQLVEVYLRRLNITPIKINIKKESFFRALFRRKRVSDRDLTVFTRQFSVILEAGLPIVKSLEVLVEQQKNPYFKEVLKDIKTKVETGSSLSDALAEYPKVFDKLYIQMVKSGESSGNLDEVLKRLALHLEKIMAIKSKVKHAMVYPSVIMAVTITVISIIMIFVIPKFAEIYESAGHALPLPTQILINISRNFGKILMFFIILAIGSFLGIRYYRNTEKGRYNTDKILLHLPLIGELFHKSAVARVARTLANLVGGGVPLLQAINIAGETSGNMVIAKAMEEIRINVSAGQSIADPMFYTGVFPYLMVEMVRVGELSGKLEDMLNKVADFFEDEVDRMVNTLSTLIEPILIVVLGVVVGGILIALYLPIFKLGEVIGGM
ncbi:type II secretion system F family protein [Thermodesulfobacterium hydrogeniphilum]|uniref:type II secretion system F family protein n=1 Tax=Thermodesulfobacterium hydrogeniphilum TaxID=161156 RepID=UPI000570EB8A|nr:type II secretion system F family protein [Thermodesulfobacterium hydrogeniphilum]